MMNPVDGREAQTVPEQTVDRKQMVEIALTRLRDDINEQLSDQPEIRDYVLENGAVASKLLSVTPSLFGVRKYIDGNPVVTWGGEDADSEVLSPANVLPLVEQRVRELIAELPQDSPRSSRATIELQSEVAVPLGGDIELVASVKMVHKEGVGPKRKLYNSFFRAPEGVFVPLADAILEEYRQRNSEEVVQA